MKPKLPPRNLKEATKLCWFCNRKFRGNKKYEITIPTPSGDKTQYAHKICIDFNKHGFDLRIEEFE